MNKFSQTLIRIIAFVNLIYLGSYFTTLWGMHKPHEMAVTFLCVIWILGYLSQTWLIDGWQKISRDKSEIIKEYDLLLKELQEKNNS